MGPAARACGPLGPCGPLADFSERIWEGQGCRVAARGGTQGGGNPMALLLPGGGGGGRLLDPWPLRAPNPVFLAGCYKRAAWGEGPVQRGNQLI